MAIRKISYQESLEVIWDELIYTRSRLEADAKAKDLAGPLQDLVGRLFAVKQGQYKSWEEEIMAQAQVDTLDYALDEAVDDLSHRLEQITRRDRKSPRWTRYFGSDAPFTIRRLGLANEIQRVSGWVDSLKSEAESELKELGARLEKIVIEGKNALLGREKAAAARADHRAREIMTFIDDINAIRLSLYGELISRVSKYNQTRSWPEEFFCHTTASPRQKTTNNAGSTETE